ncbi:hypothetical protein Goklo_010855, partial [Gossypium klotzschianum]|nr:hypothetical protein [Gossypium klotzschianum]
DEDRIIETYIHNLSTRAPHVIEQYLKEARFLHVSCMLHGTKLEPTVISVLLERWRLKIYTIHLLCGNRYEGSARWRLKANLPPAIRQDVGQDVSHVGISNKLEDIQLLLNQQSKADVSF